MSSRAHAVLSASGAHRWMNCPGSVRLEKDFPNTSSVYADEGTLAHEFVEAGVKLFAGQITEAIYKRTLIRLRKKELYSKEMEDHADSYVDLLKRESENASKAMVISSETRVDLGDWIPKGFGTCDTIMADADSLTIVDFKYGQGVRVDAPDNPQLRLYALGAYRLYRGIYSFSKVRMVIHQPRINHISTDELTLEELLDFGDEVKRKARLTEEETAPCNAGTWCQFCKAKSVCRARADLVVRTAGFLHNGDTLKPEEYKELIEKAEQVKEWLASAKEHIYSEVLAGHRFPGFKLVEGRSTREWTDADKAFGFIISEGFLDEAVLYEKKMISLTAVEKLLGKKEFSEKLGAFVTKPRGKPQLVSDDDSRPEFNPITAVFTPSEGEGVTEEK